jgi:predicted nucleic acid-binding protein
MIVVDTNVIAYLFLWGAHTERSRSAFLKDPEWAAPLLWRSEFRNVLALYLRKKQLSYAEAIRLASEAEKLMQGREYQVSSHSVLNLAAASKCSAYDCEFVALAEHLRLPLVTSDSGLLKEFPKIAVSLGEFSS